MNIITPDKYYFNRFNPETDFIKVVDKFLLLQPVFYDKARNWWIWNHKDYCWELIDETDLMNSIDDKTESPSVKSYIKTELLEAFKRRARLNQPIKRNDIIQFKNILVNIKTGERFEASPKYFITNPIPWDIGQTTETPVMDKIFKEWVDERYLDTLYQIIAYCLLPDYPIQRLFCLFGEGANGKSKFLELIKNFIGVNNIASTELDTLLGSRFEVTRLHKKLVCLMGETNFSELSKTSLIKKLTGGDLIGFEYKNKELFQDHNYAKIIISTNNIPPTSDKTIGFARRWLIIDFPNRFNEDKDILLEIPQEEYNNLALKCLNILESLLKERKFKNEGSMEDRVKKYEEHSNPFDKFWLERVKEDPEGSIYKYEFKEELESWCQENRFRKMTDKVISKYMKEKGIDDQRLSANWFDEEGNVKRYWAWIGVKWKEK